jgi:monoamine oxidase
VQSQVSAFLNDLDVVFPGAKAAATKLPGNKYRAHLEHWPSNPNSLGSYTCYLPGQFTSIAGNEGKSVDNLYFAGEHTNSFYEWQGFMEGACLSGIDAADAILADWG